MSDRPAIELVILSSVHWHFTWQRHHEIAARLAALDYKVTYVEPLPKRWPGPAEWRRVRGRLFGRHVAAGLLRQRVPPGVELANALTLPDVGGATRWLNRSWATPRAATRLGAGLGRPRVVLNYLPLAASIDLQRRLAPDLAIYDCVWDWPHDPYSRAGVVREEALIAAVDMVFADSPSLFDRMRQQHRRVERVLPAVDYDLYEPARRRLGAPAEPLRCAYFGALGANIDLPLLRRLSREFALRLIGPIQQDLGELGAGTEILGPVAQAELPALLAAADVLVLPYRRAAHSAGVIPAKTFECLATGKPCVAAGLDSLAEFGDCFHRVEGEEAFVAAVEAAAKERPKARGARLAVARANDWKSRATQIDDLIRDALAVGKRA
jgi:glycosyltransferase involved in cell wall biosynthesis